MCFLPSTNWKYSNILSFGPSCLQTWIVNGQYYGLATKIIKANFSKKHRFALWNNAACYRAGCARLQGMSVFILPVKPENCSQWIQLPGYHSCIQKLHSLSTLPFHLVSFSQSQYCAIFILPFHVAGSRDEVYLISAPLNLQKHSRQGTNLSCLYLFGAISLDK